MERSSLEQLFGALERHRARYLVAGGLAVLAHGFVRVTLDDLLAMKRAAGRPQDLTDIDRLERLRRVAREDG